MRCSCDHGLLECFASQDATNLATTLQSSQRYDGIIFNFPHSGFPDETRSFREAAQQTIASHQALVSAFLLSAKDLLKPSGAVVIVHKTAHPFDRWDIPRLAREAGYHLAHTMNYATGKFLGAHSGYSNVYGSGRKIAKSFPTGACARYVFKLEQGVWKPLHLLHNSNAWTAIQIVWILYKIIYFL
jgi:hypothetical protein